MMQVEVFAKTQLANIMVRRRLDDFESSDPDVAHEYAGRLCYKSFKKPNPETATNATYLERSIIGREHFSVLEHAHVSFHVRGVSRNMLLELERHRHLSFSVVSQRFVDSSTVRFVLPPAVLELGRLNWPHLTDLELEDKFQLWFVDDLDAYSELEQGLREVLGKSRKQAREAARSVLAGSAETEFIVTGNLRTWREIIAKRTAPDADAEIQQFALKVREKLEEYAPNSMQGM